MGILSISSSVVSVSLCVTVSSSSIGKTMLPLEKEWVNSKELERDDDVSKGYIVMSCHVMSCHVMSYD